MDTHTFFDFSNKSLNLTYSIIDILIAIIFFALVFGALYKAFSFSVRTISLILSSLFGGIMPKKDNYNSYEDDLNSDIKNSRRACFTEDEKFKQKSNKKNLMIEEGTNKTIDDILNNKNSWNKEYY